MKTKINISLSIISLIISIISLTIILEKKDYLNLFSDNKVEYLNNDEFLNKNEIISFKSIDERLNFLTKNKDLSPFCEKGYIYSFFKDSCLNFINKDIRSKYDEAFLNAGSINFDKTKSIEENCKNIDITKEEGCIDGFIYLFSLSDEFEFGTNKENKIFIYEKEKIAEINSIELKKI